MKAIGKIITVLSLTLIAFSSDAQVKSNTSHTEPVKKVAFKQPASVSKRIAKQKHRTPSKPIKRVPVQRTTVKEVPVKQ
jgi:hypothetical protein